MKILLIEDDESFVEALQQALITQRYVVDVAIDGQAGWELAQFSDYDLILLDLQLPNLDGIAFCQRLRTYDQETPVLLLTVQDDNASKVAGLDAGADDYMVKPCDLEELLARIRALLRRGSAALSPILTWGDLHIDPQNCQVTYRETSLSLTVKEYSLLELFLRNPQRIFSQRVLIDRLWSVEETPNENTVRAHIKGLRQKLKRAGAQDVIETMYGLGYRLKPENSSVQTDKRGEEKKEPTRQAISEAARERVPDFTAIWERHRERYHDRVEIIEQAIYAIQAGTLTDALLQQAKREAHTLIGSVGSFGLLAATQLARQIEQQLMLITLATSLSLVEIDLLLQQVQALRQSLQQSPTVSQPTVTPPPIGHQHLRLLIVAVDCALAEQLVGATQHLNQRFCLGHRNIQAEIALHPTQARAAIAAATPDVVLLELSCPTAPEAELELDLLAELASHQPAIPVVVLTARDAVADRVLIARLGAQSFLSKPIAPTQVLAAICQVLQRNRQGQAKLMAVDDDPHLLEVLRGILSPGGFSLTLLNDPRQFWDTLQRTQPDLLILNVEMPTFNGIDLCQAVRNDWQWHSLPILFLSASTDEHTIAQVFSAGADDYVNKPIVPTELISRVVNRLDRVQSRRQG